jgi:hypothetical protein
MSFPGFPVRQAIPPPSPLIVISLMAGLLSACGISSAAPTPIGMRLAVVPVSYAADFALFDNGQMVEQPFLSTYRTMEGDRWLGRPIAKSINDTDLGWRLQVFEFGVLAEDPSDRHIFLVKMSDLLGRRQAAATASGDPACSYMTETGHNLCYEFRDFVQAAGKERVGQPVAEMAMDDQGALYQDFEYARLRFLRGGMDRERIGEIFFTQRGYDPALRQPVVSTAGPAAGSTRIYASLARTTLRPGEEQSLRVVVSDPTGAGIAGIPLRVALQKNGEAILEIDIPATDASGISSLTFRVPQADPGTRIRVLVSGTVNGEELDAVSEFEVWW